MPGTMCSGYAKALRQFDPEGTFYALRYSFTIFSFSPFA